MESWIFVSLLPALSSGSTSASSSDLALRSCLSRLLVVHCSSSSQLILTLHLLETSFSSRPSLAVLLIDSISAFYWLDRSEGGASITKQEEKLSKCSDLLARLLRYLVCWSGGSLENCCGTKTTPTHPASYVVGREQGTRAWCQTSAGTHHQKYQSSCKSSLFLWLGAGPVA